MGSPFFLGVARSCRDVRCPARRTPMIPFTLALNAGGRSRRMGQNKALLPVPPDDVPLLAVLSARLAVLQPQRLLVISDDPAVCALAATLPHARCLPDRFPGQGPLSGIATALTAADGWMMMLACDMPLLDPGVLAELLARADDTVDAVVPHVNDRFQTMHALYHRRCLPAVEAAIARGKLRAVAFYADVRVATVDEPTYRRFDPHLRSLANVNTPEEWAEVQELLASVRGAGE